MFVRSSIQRFAQVALAVMIAVAILAAALPRPAQAAVNATCEETITIKEGDTIYNLSKKYEVSVNKLARANDLEKPYTLTVGQKFCIPKVPAPSSDYKWNAVFKNGQIALAGEKFKKSHPFNVKVREVDQSTWYKLGKVVTDKNGKLAKTYKLPKDLTNVPALYVCLKDGVTDYLDCKRVVKQ
jgi:hypothetical protein